MSCSLFFQLPIDWFKLGAYRTLWSWSSPTPDTEINRSGDRFSPSLGDGWTDWDRLHDRHRMLSQSDCSTTRRSESTENIEVAMKLTPVSVLQKVLTQTMHWPCGYYQPMLTPAEIPLPEKKTESDLTDVEILEHDLVKCLFRMNVLKRIVYLLDRMKLLPKLTVLPSVKSAFAILIRMARHSMSAANQVRPTS